MWYRAEYRGRIIYVLPGFGIAACLYALSQSKFASGAVAWTASSERTLALVATLGVKFYLAPLGFAREGSLSLDSKRSFSREPQIKNCFVTTLGTQLSATHDQTVCETLYVCT